MSARWAWVAAAFCVLSGVAGYWLAEGYIDRLPNHHGYYRVAVADAVAVPAATRPRHAVLILVDGLRADHARGMASVARLRAAGQCRLTDVGPLSVSRPVYTVVSTGLEQDRTGVRNNDCTTQIPVDSIYQLTRRAGRRVYGVSELPWVRQLFPDGFDGYEVIPRSQDHFTRTEAELGDLSLFLPIYVDENAHDFGAASDPYRQAVARADQEIERLLSRLDLQRDLVVLTADHGHSDRGGHGARSPEVAQVLTCFSGLGVQRLDDAQAAPITSRVIAPALSLLTGLPFPRNMRAGEDDLDALFAIADPAVYGADYLTDRRAALARFRSANRQAVAGWLGRAGEADWSELYQRQSHRQILRGLALLLVIAVAIAVGSRLLWRRAAWRTVGQLAGSCVLACGLLVVLWIGLRGSFDFTSMNQRADFIRWIMIASFSTLVLLTALHWLRFRSLRDLGSHLLALLALLDSVNLAHIVAYGLPMGFPLPGPTLLFLPFVTGSFQAVIAVAALASCLVFGMGSNLWRRQAPSPTDAPTS